MSVVNPPVRLRYPDGTSVATVSPRPLSLDLRDYGAVSGANCDAAFLAAFAAMPSGGRLRVPAGDWQIAATDIVTTGIVIEGEGPGSVIRSTATAGRLRMQSDTGVKLIKFIGGTAPNQYGVDVDTAAAQSNITVQDCLFSGAFAQSIHVDGSVTGTAHSQIRIKDNVFNGFSASAAYIVVCDHGEINGNISTSANSSAQHFLLNAGSHNRVTRNDITFGKTGINWIFRRDIVGGYASQRNVVANNTIRNISEESISFDVNGIAGDRTGAVELDTISAKSNPSTGVYLLTLANSGWSSAPSGTYPGMWITFTSGSARSRAVKITANSAGTFTVAMTAAQYAAVTVGDEVSITQPPMMNTISANTIDTLSRGTTSAIYLYGCCLGNSITGNTIYGTDIRVSSLTGLAKPATNYTNSFGVALAEGNVVTGNTVVEGNIKADFIDFGGGGPSAYSAVGNIVDKNSVIGGTTTLTRQA